MNKQSDIEAFVKYCESTLDLVQNDPNLVFYKSLPLCILDAVFSIGVKYVGVMNVEKNYIKYFGLSVSRNDAENEHTIDDFLVNVRKCSNIESFAADVLHNRQRTSSRNGILKAEACRQVAEIFHDHGINTLKDFREYPHKEALDKDILAVTGQGSGIMLKYLYMLAGDSGVCKPDRHLERHIRKICPDVKSHEEIQELMCSAVTELKTINPKMTVRLLDYAIWIYQKGQSGK